MKTKTVQRIDHNVEIGAITKDLVDHVRSSPGSETMVADVGFGIKEHRHGKSLYFACNAHLTLEGKVYEVGPMTFYALIPEGVSHGWQHAGEEEQAVITSLEAGHDVYETYRLE